VLSKDCFDLRIAPAEAADFPAIAALNIEAYREFAGTMSAENWQAMQESLGAVEDRAEVAQFLVTKDRGAIVGSVAYCPPGEYEPQVFPPDWAGLYLLSVAPAQRGRGIGRGLANACVQRAIEDSATAIGLFTSEVMTEAQLLYESLGFCRESELPQRYGLRYWRYRLSF
jgi:ribosomal protein S18 acetylase RimI-like enzyme